MNSSRPKALTLSFTIPLSSLLALLMAFGCDSGPKPQRLPTVNITLGGKTIPVEVARTPEERQVGMMYRKRIGPDEGMLFVFPEEQTLYFYMKNTYVPLSIAYIRSNGVIANIASMQPLDLRTHPSRLPCRYALEMPQGWFARNGVKEGDKVVLPDKPVGIQ